MKDLGFKIYNVAKECPNDKVIEISNPTPYW